MRINFKSVLFCNTLIFVTALAALHTTVYVLAMVGNLENVSPTFAQMLNRITNVEFTTVSPTIANTMLCVRAFVHSTMSYYYSY